MNLMRMAALAVWLFLPVFGQVTPLRVVSAAPAGELARIEDAGEVRIVFSEPMVALGAHPLPAAPPWLEMTPASPGTFYWSGTRTLIFSPDAQRPLPFATTFTVRIAASAASIGGVTLGTPFALTFTTPTPRLMDTQWRRKTGRFDAPIVFELTFNQPMNPETLLPHLTVSLRPYGWTAPRLSNEARKALARTDPKGLAQFDAKVARVREITMKSDRVELRPSDAPPRRDQPHPERVVMLETVGVPPTSVLLDVAIDASLPSLQGRERHAAQSTVLALDHTFFVTGTSCESACDPDKHNAMKLTAPVASAGLSNALVVTDVTESSRARRIEPGAAESFDDASEFIWFRDIGYEHQAPAHTWRLQVSADLPSVDGQTLGYPWLGFVRTSHGAPFIGIDGTVWEASAGTSLPVSARNVQSWTHEIGVVAPAQIIPRLAELNARQAFGGTKQRRVRRLTAPPGAVHVHDLDVKPLLSPGGTGIVTMALLPNETVPGAIRVPDSLLDRRIIQITNLGITVKDGPLDTLVLVTRLDSGAPVPAASVSIVDDTNQTMWRGTTDTDGVAIGPGVATPDGTSRDTLSFTVIAAKDGDTAFARANQHENVNEYDGYGSAAPGLLAAAFSDRGVYRQNDEIQFKGIIRESTQNGLRALPAKTPVQVTIRDSRGDDIDEREVSTNEWSSIDWTWRIPPRARLGDYWIEMSRAGSSTDDRTVTAGVFLVAAYRRPDFRVDVTLTADVPILGTTLHGRTTAEYLFGLPLADASVTVGVFRRDTHQPPAAVLERYPADRYAVGYLPRRPDDGPTDSPPKKEMKLGHDGRLVIDVPTAPTESGAAYAYLLESDVQNAAQQNIANVAELVLHPASIYVALSHPPTFVDASQTQRVTVATVDLSGKTVVNVPVSIALLREAWVEEVSRETGFLRWEAKETPIAEWSVQTTGSDVPASFQVRTGGVYILRATARDAEGRLTRTEARFYALGGATTTTWRSDSEHRLTLVPERTTWKPGETARILVQSPWPHATALVTLEREGIRRHHTVTIRSTQDTVDVPITAADAPGVFVSVMVIRGRTSTALDAEGDDPGKPSYSLGYARLEVEDPAKRLRVEITADKTEYRPGGLATVTARVAAPDGRPASTEVTLWAVDYGLLSLTKYTLPDLHTAMRGQRPLLVRTADNRLHLIGRGPMSPPPSRSGLSEAVTVQASTSARGPLAEPPFGARSEQGIDLRKDFRPLAFWLGSTTTDDDGRATTTVTLPDSLTTYRIMAVAADRDSRFGSGQLDVRVDKSLTLVPALPRFLNSGDRASIGAVVTNQRSSTSNAVVTLESVNAGTLRLEGAARQSIPIPAGAAVPVRFTVVAQKAGTTRVRMTVRLDDETDGFEVPLHVTEQVRLQTTAAYGETTGTAIERLTLPASVVPGSGGLSIDLASSALVGLGESARYLDEYPYRCAEQQASRALALVFAAELGSAFKLSTTVPAEYRTAAAAAVEDLYRFQCEDGGFALWEGQCRTQSAYLTAYVLHVLKVADSLKIGTNANAIDDALRYLDSRLTTVSPSSAWWPVSSTAQAYALRILAEYGRKPSVQIATLAESADRLSIVGLSHLADALYAMGDRGSRYQGLVRRLLNAARIDADRAHVEELDESALGWLWLSNVNATAVVLDGLSRRRDDVTLAAPMVRWLIAAQRKGRWGSTHESALALEALVTFHRAFERGTGDMTAIVSVGSATVGTATIPPGSTVAQHLSVPIAELVELTSGSNTEVALSRVGDGRLYYTARLQYTTPESPEAIERGYAVTRRYERYVDGKVEAPGATFNAGDLVRITVSVTLRGEGRYLALVDPLPAGFEPLETRLATTAQSAVREALRSSREEPWLSSLEGGPFEHFEPHDDRIVAFATRLGSGTHELTYLVRATTAGTFSAPGARVEAMYAPELEGRSAAATVIVTSRP